MKDKYTLRSKSIEALLLSILFLFTYSATSQPPDPNIQYEVGGGAGHYNYAPSAIQDEYGIRYVFMCQNKNPFEIVDYLYLYKAIPTKTGYQWQPGTMIMPPSEKGWDDIHICDPDVREFKTTYKGEEYNWIMTYLGVDQWHNHNQIGLAFSKNIEGPYIKYDKNPLVTYDDRTKWGVGQSTSIVLDSTTIRLFYHKSDKPSFRSRDIKMNNLDSIDIGEERPIPFLASNTGVGVSDENIYAVEERGFVKTEIPTWVGTQVRFSYQPLTKDIYDEKDDWIKVDSIGPGSTGFPRNHNAGFLTDKKGYMLSEEDIVIYFTVAMTGENWLWSYDMYSWQLNLKTLLNDNKN